MKYVDCIFSKNFENSRKLSLKWTQVTQKNWERSNESLKYRTFSTLSGHVLASSLFIRWFYRNLKMSLIPIVRLICYFHQLFALIRVYSWQTRVFTRPDPKNHPKFSRFDSLLLSWKSCKLCYNCVYIGGTTLDCEHWFWVGTHKIATFGLGSHTLDWNGCSRVETH